MDCLKYLYSITVVLYSITVVLSLSVIFPSQGQNQASKRDNFQYFLTTNRIKQPAAKVQRNISTENNFTELGPKFYVKNPRIESFSYTGNTVSIVGSNLKDVSYAIYQPDIYFRRKTGNFRKNNTGKNIDVRSLEEGTLYRMYFYQNRDTIFRSKHYSFIKK